MPIVLFLKSHIKGYIKQDGTFVREHEDVRPTTNASRVAREMAAAIAAHGGKGHYGLRVDSAKNSRSQAEIGGKLAPSSQFKDGTPTKRVLVGTSGVKLKGQRPEHIEDALHAMNLGGRNNHRGYYVGENVHLIHSAIPPNPGRDPGEGVYKDATLVARWRKRDDGPSEIMPKGDAFDNG